MNKILITGAYGQIGSELTLKLREKYGNENVIASDLRDDAPTILKDGKNLQLDIMDNERLEEIIKENEIDAIFHLAAILSATGEKNPFLCWNVNMTGTLNIIKATIKYDVKKVFIPSSIAVWGPGVPLYDTPQESVLKPTTMYGVTKVSGEVLSDYFVRNHNLDIRGIRYPGIISSETLPGGGTTDYAVEIFYEAVKTGKYECFLNEDATLPMMYMPDCIKATIDLMEAPKSNLKHHSDFNVAAFSFSPAELANEIKKHIPEFEITYKPDERQKIADSWPKTIDDSSARDEWNWSPNYNLSDMTAEMIDILRKRHKEGKI